MPNHRFYSQDKLKVGQSLPLDKNLSNHIQRVLRLGDGAVIQLFDGDGYDYQARLKAEGKRLAALLEDRVENNSRSPITTHLGQAICRGDRMDYSIQKAVELGVNIITPLISERVQFRMDAKRLAKKMQHWLGVIHSACEQSGRADIPVLKEPQDLSDWLDEGDAVTIMLAPEAPQSLGDLLQDLADLKPEILRLGIGPEGGFSEAELQAAGGRVKTGRLGPRILRTETAGTATLTMIQHYLGDF
jgi:16S rRNA (uracil1498-N3)-methyltransferase